MSAEAQPAVQDSPGPLGPRRHILVIEPDHEAAVAMAGALRAHGYQAAVAASGAEAQQAARGEAPDAFVVDLGLGDMSATELIGLLRARDETAAAPIIALSASADAAQRLAGLRAGASDYLLAPVDGEELVARLATALALCREKAGLVLAVQGSKGGVGASIVAANLAVALRRATRARVLLVDGARPQGVLDVLLNLRPAHNAAQLLSRLSELEPADIEGLLTPHASGLQVLSLAGTGLALEPGALRSLLATLRRLQYLVVVDAGSLLDDPTAAVAELADRVLLVLTPEIPALRGARSCLQWLGARGVGQGRVVPVLNRYPQAGGLPRRDVERILGMPVQGLLPDDIRLVAYSVNRGIPVVESHPKSGLARRMRALAGGVVQGREGEVAARRSGLPFGWPRRRTAAKAEATP